jgi:hypothetical protein
MYFHAEPRASLPPASYREIHTDRKRPAKASGVHSPGEQYCATAAGVQEQIHEGKVRLDPQNFVSQA